MRSSDLADHQQGRFGTDEWNGVLTVDASYVIVGMGVWETALQVLVRSDHGLPAWVPAALFEIADRDVPQDWGFAVRDGINRSGQELWTRWVYQWGYAELIDNERHSDLIQERDSAALAIFNAEYDKAEAVKDPCS